MSVERERKDHTTSRLQQHQQPHQEVLALCHRVTLDSEAHQWVPARTPTVHWCPTGKAVGGPQQALRDDSRQTTRQTLSQTCFHKQVQSDTCNHTETLKKSSEDCCRAPGVFLEVTAQEERRVTCSWTVCYPPAVFLVGVSLLLWCCAGARPRRRRQTHQKHMEYEKNVRMDKCQKKRKVWKTRT